jgi:hypothetical protein
MTGLKQQPRSYLEGPFGDGDDESIERVWAAICKYAAQKAGISVERATAILEENGFNAYWHTGVVEAVDVVNWALGRR